MANFIERDKRKRTSFIEGLSRRTKIKSTLKERKLDMSSRYKMQIILNKLKSKAQRESLVNRCVHSERIHSVLSSYRLSRIELRNLASDGRINGLKKSSW